MIPFAVASITFALGMVPAGRLQDKKGPKIVAAGGMLTGLGYILSSTAVYLWQLILYFGFIGGIGIALGYSGAVAGGVKWFPDLKGTAAGILVGGFGLGALVFGPAIHIVKEEPRIKKVSRQPTCPIKICVSYTHLTLPTKA